MNVNDLYKRISRKCAQLAKAEKRVAEDPSKFNINNYYTTRYALHSLALQLAEETK